MRPVRLTALAVSAAVGLGSSRGPAIGAADGSSGRAAGQQPGTLMTEFWAVSANGAPVVDLAAAEMSASVAGVPREIQSLELVSDIPSRDATLTPTGPEPAGLLPAPFATNAPSGGRTFYLVLDGPSPVPGPEPARWLQSALDGLVSAVRPDDELALARVGPGPVVSPTTDRDAIRAALTPSLEPSVGQSGSPAPTRAERCLGRLRSLFNTLANSREPPIVVLLSSGLPASVVSETREEAAGAARPGSSHSNTVVSAETFKQLRVAEAKAGASLYVVSVASTTGLRNQLVDGLRQAANELGAGFLPVDSANLALPRIVKETSSHYRITLRASTGDRPGTTYPLALSCLRPSVTVRAVPVIVSAASTAEATPSIADLLTSEDESRGVTLRVAAFSSRAETHVTDKVRVTLAIEPVDPGRRLVAVGSAVVDSTGRIVATNRVAPGRDGAAATRSEMIVAAGRYRLRVAALDDLGHTGTLETPEDFRLERAGSLMLGTMALGLAPVQMSQRGVRPGPGAGQPEVRLEFSSEPEALAFFDLYGGSANEQISVAMDVLRRPDGPPIQEIQPRIQPARAGEPDHYLVTAPIDLTRLAPGDYLVQATVSLPGQRPSVLTRTLRKTKLGSSPKPAPQK